MSDPSQWLPERVNETGVSANEPEFEKMDGLETGCGDRSVSVRCSYDDGDSDGLTRTGACQDGHGLFESSVTTS